MSEEGELRFQTFDNAQPLRDYPIKRRPDDNIVGTPQSPAMNYYTVYTTRNECSGEIKQKTYTTTVSTSSPKVGQCR